MGEADAGKVAELTTGEGKWWAGRVTKLAWQSSATTRGCIHGGAFNIHSSLWFVIRGSGGHIFSFVL